MGLRKIRIVAVSYLNTKPFVHSINKYLPSDLYELQLHDPSKCAKLLLSNQADVGLLPVAICSELDSYHFLTDYGIAGNGPVHSVIIASNAPIENISRLILDSQSRTSNQLARILMREYWKQNTPILASTYLADFDDSTAYVLIGDKTFGAHEKWQYIYDLSAYWKDFTGLPFTFARWICTNELPEWHDELNRVFELGFKELEHVISKEAPNYPKVDVRRYLTEYIKYELDDSYHQGLSFFLEQIESVAI